MRSILPPSADLHEIALEMAHASRIDSLPVPVRDIQRPEQSPAAFLPWLAWDNGVTWWDMAWTEQQQRDVISNARWVNQRRGTAGAVLRALASLGYPAEMVEWFNDTPKAAPYTFRVVLHAALGESEITLARDMVMDAKNVRSFLSDISVSPPEVEGRYFIGAVLASEVTAIIGVKT